MAPYFIVLFIFFAAVCVIFINIGNADYEKKRKSERGGIASARNIDVSERDNRSLDTNVIDADLQHEHDRSVKEATEYKQWLEEKRKEEARRRLDEIVRQAEKMAHECAEETERMNNSGKHSEKILKPSIYLFPIMLAVASLFDMPSWFYTLFKVVVLIEAVVLIGIRLNDGKFRSEKVAIGTAYMAFMAVIGIFSFINGGFPRSFWMFLDIGYCIMHVLIYIGFIKGGNSSD